MDNKNKQDNKKLIPFQQQKLKQQFQNIQPTYYNPNKKFENAKPTHMELYNLFLTESFDTIKKEIYNNINLKINTENGNLINAVIENESLDEFNKIQILQELINNRNIDVNEKNKYDQLPLHTACKKEYYEIIKFLIDKSDKTELDVFGNAPIHYLTQFILKDCDHNSYYNALNAESKINKPSVDDIKFFKILLHAIQTVITNPVTIDPVTIDPKDNNLSNLIAFISFNKFFDVDSFEKVIKEKIDKIKNIYGDYKDIRNINLKKETALSEISNEFKNFYKNFKIGEIIKDEDIEKNIKSLKQKSENDIKKNKTNIEETLNSIGEEAQKIKEIFFDNTVSTVFVLKYVYETLWSYGLDNSKIKIEDYLEKCKGYDKDDYSNPKLQMLIKIICIIKKYIKQGDPIMSKPGNTYNYIDIEKYDNLLDFSIHKFNPSINTFDSNNTIDPTNKQILNTGGINNNGYIDEWKNFLGILKSDGKYEDILKKIKYDVIFLIMVEFKEEGLSFIKDIELKQKEIITNLNGLNINNNNNNNAIFFDDSEITANDIHNTYDIGNEDNDNTENKKNKIKFFKNNGYYMVKNKNTDKSDNIKLDNEYLIKKNDFYYINTQDIEYNKNLFLDENYNYILIGDCLIGDNKKNNVVDEEYYSIDFSNFKFGNVHIFFKDIEKYIKDTREKIQNDEPIIFCIYDCINILEESIIIFDKMKILYDYIFLKKKDILDIKSNFKKFKNNITEKYDKYENILKNQIDYIEIVIKEYNNIDNFFNNLYLKIIELLYKINNLIVEYNKNNSIKYLEHYNDDNDTLDIELFHINKFKQIINNNDFPKNFNDYILSSVNISSFYEEKWLLSRKNILFYLNKENYNEIYLKKNIVDKKNHSITKKLLPKLYDFLTIESDELIKVYEYKYKSKDQDIKNNIINKLKVSINYINKNSYITKYKKHEEKINYIFDLNDVLTNNKIFLPILFNFIPLISYYFYEIEDMEDKKKNLIGFLQRPCIELIKYFIEFLDVIIEIMLLLNNRKELKKLLQNIYDDIIEITSIKNTDDTNIILLEDILEIVKNVNIVVKLYDNFLQFVIEYKNNVKTDLIIDNDTVYLHETNYPTPIKKIKDFINEHNKINNIFTEDIKNNIIKSKNSFLDTIDLENNTNIKQEDKNFLLSIKIFSVLSDPILKNIDYMREFSKMVKLKKTILYKNNKNTDFNIYELEKKIYKKKYINNIKNRQKYKTFLDSFISQYLINKITEILDELKDITKNDNVLTFYKNLNNKDKIKFIKKYYKLNIINNITTSDDDKIKKLKSLDIFINIIKSFPYNTKIDYNDIDLIDEIVKNIKEKEYIIEKENIEKENIEKEFKSTEDNKYLNNLENKNFYVKYIKDIFNKQTDINNIFEESGENIDDLVIKENDKFTEGYLSILFPVDEKNLVTNNFILPLKENKNIIYPDYKDSTINKGKYIIKFQAYKKNTLSSLDIQKPLTNSPIISLYNIQNIITIIFNKLYDLLKNGDYELLKKYFEDEVKKNFNNIFINYGKFITQENVIKDALKTYLETLISGTIITEINNIKTNLNTILPKVGGAITDDIKEDIKNEMQKIIERRAFSIGHVTKLKINKAVGNKLFNDKCYNNNTIEKILSFNFDLLQQNTDGLSFLDIVINQFNHNAVGEIIKKLKNIEIPDRININLNNYIMNKSLKYDNIEKEVNEFQKKLISKLNNTKEFDYLGIDIRNTFIINTIMNSFYIFNEFIWLKTKTTKNDNNYENITSVINKFYDLFLKTLNIDNTKLAISNINSSNIDEYSRNIAQNEKILRGNNDKYDKYDADRRLEPDTTRISDMEKINKKITEINKEIKKSILITDKFNIDYNAYNKLIKKEINGNYIQIIKLINNNKDSITNANLKIISESKNIQNINYFTDYFKTINDKICINYFDFDKDDYYNTANSTTNYENNNKVSYNIIEILKLNLLNILTIEIIGVLNFIGNKKNTYDSDKIDAITKAENKMFYDKYYDIIKNMLYDIMIEHNSILMSPNKSYENFNTSKVQVIKKFLEFYSKNEDDMELNKFLEQMFNFYKILTEDISEYIYNMIVEYIKDLQQLYYLYEIKRILSTIE